LQKSVILMSVRSTILTFAAAAVLASCSRPATDSVPALLPAPMLAPHAALDGIAVKGNALVDGSGTPVRLHGVNRSGTEYACAQGWGIFDGPNDGASLRAIASWHVNVVRVPLNEDCWLAINGVKAKYAGANYRKAVVAYVNALHANGMYAEVSLIWGAPGTYLALYQPGGPDEDHSPAMWSSMAATFKNDRNVILAPWGETITGWQCFMRTGCDNEATYGKNNKPYRTASMRQAVQHMRGAGFHGPISIPCIDYANDCSKWLTYRPDDPDRQIVAEAHVYGKNTCDAVACFDSTMAPVAKRVPLVFGETGETYDGKDCGSAYISTFLPWADAHGVGYEAWTWDTWGGCGVLIKTYGGKPANAWARWVQAHYLAL
jgi:endoglucanase